MTGSRGFVRVEIGAVKIRLRAHGAASGARQALEALSEILEERLEFFLKLAALCKELGTDPAHGGDEINQHSTFLTWE